MSIIPIITFKAGFCEVDVSLSHLRFPRPPLSSVANSQTQQSVKPYKINPQPKKGYIYLYSEEGMTPETLLRSLT